MTSLDPHFRKFDGQEVLMNIRQNDLAPLILVRSGGEMRFASTANKKNEIVDLYDPEDGDVLLYVWTGKTRTDVFQITPEDLHKHFIK